MVSTGPHSLGRSALRFLVLRGSIAMASSGGCLKSNLLRHGLGRPVEANPAGQKPRSQKGPAQSKQSGKQQIWHRIFGEGLHNEFVCPGEGKQMKSGYDQKDQYFEPMQPGKLSVLVHSFPQRLVMQDEIDLNRTKQNQGYRN